MEETNMERLLEFKENWKFDGDIRDGDIDWLIEQAEHTQKLVVLANERGTSVTFLSTENLELRNENKRFREALDNIMRVDGEYYSHDAKDMKKIAHQALTNES